MRGMGVAVMTSMSGAGALGGHGKPLVDAETVLLVDDGSARSWKEIACWKSAWVPMTMSVRPSSMPP